MTSSKETPLINTHKYIKLTERHQKLRIIQSDWLMQKNDALFGFDTSLMHVEFKLMRDMEP